MKPSGRPTIAEIDLSALKWNYRVLKARARTAEVMAVVKADAYGHGAVGVSRALAAEGCRHFGVATVGEGCELREAGLVERIFLLDGFAPDEAREITRLHLTPTLFDLGSIRAMEAAASDAAPTEGFSVHLKIDTGAGRLGVRPEELDTAIDEVMRSPHLRLEGVSTLLANAGDPQSPVTDMQLRVFKDALATMERRGLRTRYAHLANSAAIALRTDSHFNLVRPGLALYGLPPVPAAAEVLDLHPVMTFRSGVVQLKRLPAGAGVSYGHTFVTSRPSVIGVLAVGYADGYRRGLQHGGQVLVRGRRAPVVGAVCMDLTMVDLTDIPEACVGDEAVLWGRAGEEVISVNDVARLVQTISYEMLCTVGKRVPRVFHE